MTETSQSLQKMPMQQSWIKKNLLVFVYGNHGKTHLYLWEEFIDSRLETLCIITDGTVESQNTSEVVKNTALSVRDLTKWFLSHSKGFGVQLESELNMNHVSAYNLIMIGKISQAHQNRVLPNSQQFSLNDSTLIYHHSGEGSFYPLNGTNSDMDYTIVSFSALQKKQVMLNILSHNGFGTASLVDRFTNYDWLEDFYRHMPKEQTYFNALFQVKRESGVITECTLLHMEEN